MTSTSPLRCLFCGQINPDSATFCMGCGSQLDLQPCNSCDAVDSRASTNCYKCGSQFASIWASAPVPAVPNFEPAPAPAPEPKLDATPARPRRSLLALAMAAFLVTVVAANFTYPWQSEKLVQSQGSLQVAVSSPIQSPSSGVATQMPAIDKTTDLPPKPDIGIVDLEKVSSKAASSEATTVGSINNTMVSRFPSAAIANVTHHHERPDLKECSPAVATLGLCDPEPK